MELAFVDPTVQELITEAVVGLEAADFEVTNGVVTSVEVLGMPRPTRSR